MATLLNRNNTAFLRSLQCVLLAIILLFFACIHSNAETSVRSSSTTAKVYFSQGKYEESLREYQKLLEKKPEIGDRLLFEMAIVYAHPLNKEKNYSKALECYQKIITDYPESQYRHDSQMMFFQVQNVMVKDELIAKQKNLLDTYYQQVQSQKNDIKTQQERIKSLEQLVLKLLKEPVDQILVEKKKRKLTLLLKGQAIKSYKIALGGNPVGPKERQGDNKTPEGNYTIESRNPNSKFHLSLGFSYPNANDIKHARKLGVSP